jgi:hypothetical protein
MLHGPFRRRVIRSVIGLAAVASLAAVLPGTIVRRASPPRGGSRPQRTAPRASATPPSLLSPQSLGGPSPFAACSGPPGTARDTQVEPAIAVDPADPTRVVAAWQQDRIFGGGALGVVTAASADGGFSWRRSMPPLSVCSGGSYSRVSDPVVSMGPGIGGSPGVAFLSAIGVRADRRTDVIVSTSTGGGRPGTRRWWFEARTTPSGRPTRSGCTRTPIVPARPSSCGSSSRSRRRGSLACSTWRSSPEPTTPVELGRRRPRSTARSPRRSSTNRPSSSTARSTTHSPSCAGGAATRLPNASPCPGRPTEAEPGDPPGSRRTSRIRSSSDPASASGPTRCSSA